MKKRKLIIALLVLIVSGGAFWIFIPSKNLANGAPEWITAKVAPQQILQSITATGTVEPVTQVEVGTQVSGILTSLYVDYNSVVKEGQVIAELDKSTLILDFNSKKNNLLVAESKYEFELANYTRIKTLHTRELVADSEYESALYSYESAKNNLEIAKNDLKRSETNLGYATIYSPIDGVVLSRSVEEGQTVASSFSTPTLFTIAADLKDMQVIADVDEADIGNVQEGQKAQFSVDAFPGHIFNGTVMQVRQEATIESNVVTYEVVISAANPDLKLKPGLTANIEIFVLDVMVSATVPAAALSFNPPMPPNASQKEMGGDGKKVWVKRGDKIEPQKIEAGISNGITIEVKGVSVGTEVIIGVKESNSKRAKMDNVATENPFMPKRPGGKK